MHPAGLIGVDQLQCPSDPDRGNLFHSQIGSFAFTDYCGVAGISSNQGEGIFPAFYEPSGLRLSFVTDGSSHTLAFGERPPSPAGYGFGRWLASQNHNSATIGVIEDFEFLRANQESDEAEHCSSSDVGFQSGSQGSLCDWMHHWSFHAGGANFAKVDGSVGFVPYSIDPTVLRALATRSGQEPVSLPF